MIGEMMAPKAEAFMYVLDMFTPKNSNHRVNIMANITQNALQCFLANCTITSATYLPEHLPSIVIGNAIDRQIKEIVNNVTETFDKSRVYLYGSRLYLLNYDGSDVNIYVDISKWNTAGRYFNFIHFIHSFHPMFWSDDSYHQLVGKVKMSEQQTMISQMLQKYPQKWTNIKHTIRSNLYPLVTAVDKASNLTCSFSLANGSFMERSKRLSEIIDAMPISECQTNTVMWRWVYIIVSIILFQFVSSFASWPIGNRLVMASISHRSNWQFLSFGISSIAIICHR